MQPALELGDPLILTSDMRLQLLDTTVHPQKNLDDDLAPSIVNRLRLSTLHTPKFDGTELCPPTQLNAYDVVLRNAAVQMGVEVLDVLRVR